MNPIMLKAFETAGKDSPDVGYSDSPWYMPSGTSKKDLNEITVSAPSPKTASATQPKEKKDIFGIVEKSLGILGQGVGIVQQIKGQPVPVSGSPEALAYQQQMMAMQMQAEMQRREEEERRRKSQQTTLLVVVGVIVVGLVLFLAFKKQ